MKIVRLLILVATLFIWRAQAQQMERHQAIAAYVYNFAKNITWKNENSIKEFQFVIISQDDAIRKEFEKLASLKTLREKPIKIQFSNKFIVPTSAHLIFFGHEFEKNLVEITKGIGGSNTLLVTDGFNDQRFIMINFLLLTNPLRFEINKANILNQGLEINPSIILLGGTEIDVASLYKESVNHLLEMQAQVDQLLLSSKAFQVKIKLSEIEIQKQNDLTTEQEKLIQSQKNELASQELKLKELQTEVRANNDILISKGIELREKEIQLRSQQAQVEKAISVFKSLNYSIDSLNQKIKQKEEILSNQGYTIESQNKILLGLAITILLIAGFLFQYIRWNKQKNKLNQQLIIKTNELEAANKKISQTNEELIQTQEEIAAQRDIVAQQNKKLESSKIIIESQNTEIRERNQNLEAEVENRTKELIEYNQQLEQFAFVSAHNLRAPVARILGLSHLLELTDFKNDPEIIEKIYITTKDLDRVVTDLNIILNVRKNNTTTLSEINLAEEIKLIKTSLASEIEETDTAIKTDLGEIKNIKTIRPYFDSILLNLVSNAIKYRHPKRAPEIFIKATQHVDYLCISVADNGLGIDLNLYGEKIFKLYSRFHDHVEGKGFGLYLAKTQIAAMGGKLEVESKVNEGTTFFVYLKA